MIKTSSACAQETVSLGRRFAANLKEQDVVILEGELGGGKTTFVKGVLEGFGYKGEVLSPSFTLIRSYLQRRLSVYHVDLYRLENNADIFSTGIEDYLYAPKSVTLIEWGEKIEGILPRYLKVVFHYSGPDRRRIILSQKGRRGDFGHWTTDLRPKR